MTSLDVHHDPDIELNTTTTTVSTPSLPPHQQPGHERYRRPISSNKKRRIQQHQKWLSQSRQWLDVWRPTLSSHLIGLSMIPLSMLTYFLTTHWIDMCDPTHLSTKQWMLYIWNPFTFSFASLAANIALAIWVLPLFPATYWHALHTPDSSSKGNEAWKTRAICIATSLFFAILSMASFYITVRYHHIWAIAIFHPFVFVFADLSFIVVLSLWIIPSLPPPIRQALQNMNHTTPQPPVAAARSTIHSSKQVHAITMAS